MEENNSGCVFCFKFLHLLLVSIILSLFLCDGACSTNKVEDEGEKRKEEQEDDYKLHVMAFAFCSVQFHSVLSVNYESSRV